MTNDDHVTEVQREAEHTGNICDEPVARSEAEGHRGLGRGGPPRPAQPPLRGQGRGRHDLGQRPEKVRTTGQPRCRGWV